jgi:hypothetical protein
MASRKGASRAKAKAKAIQQYSFDTEAAAAAEEIEPALGRGASWTFTEAECQKAAFVIKKHWPEKGPGCIKPNRASQ